MTTLFYFGMFAWLTYSAAPDFIGKAGYIPRPLGMSFLMFGELLGASFAYSG